MAGGAVEFLKKQAALEVWFKVRLGHAWEQDLGAGWEHQQNENKNDGGAAQAARMACADTGGRRTLHADPRGKLALAAEPLGGLAVKAEDGRAGLFEEGADALFEDLVWSGPAHVHLGELFL